MRAREEEPDRPGVAPRGPAGTARQLGELRAPVAGGLVGQPLLADDHDSLVPLVFPVSIISNSFVPTTGMPAWLRLLADWTRSARWSRPAGSCSATPPSSPRTQAFPCGIPSP
jgi:hypothetical protein